MGNQAIIYGRIQCARAFKAGKKTGIIPFNEAALQSLPDKDDNWPFLTRHMFSAPQLGVAPTPERGFYKTQIVHFAASFKDEYHDGEHWNAWLEKFERLVLKRLAWESAKVHVETLVHAERVFLYRSDPQSLETLEFEIEQIGFPALSEMCWQRELIELQGRSCDWLM